jgi:hypothetical protein
VGAASVCGVERVTLAGVTRERSLQAQLKVSAQQRRECNLGPAGRGALTSHLALGSSRFLVHADLDEVLDVGSFPAAAG